MAAKVTWLEGSSPLAKKFKYNNGQLEKFSYPLVKNFTSHTFECSGIRQFYEQLVDQAQQYHCLLKGNLKHEITAESRAGLTNPDDPSWVIVIDSDGLDVGSLNRLLQLLPAEFRSVNHVVQYSASQGIGGDETLRLHLFFWSKVPVSPAILKRWMTWLNLNVPEFRESITLSATKRSLKWPLDITINQNDKLIYVAPPIMKGNVPCTFEGERIQYHSKSRWKVKVDYDFNSPALRKEYASLEEQKLELINELRAKEGLPPKEGTVAQYRNVEIEDCEETFEVTGVKESSGPFTYINLDGGDSWGYYYKTKEPYIIYNFKDEARYKMSQVCPSYYKQAIAKAKEVKMAKRKQLQVEEAIKEDKKRQKKRIKKWGGVAQEDDPALKPPPDNPNPEIVPDDIVPFVFIDSNTSEYFKGTYNYTRKRLAVSRAKNVHVLKNFMKLWGMDTNMTIPEKEQRFDPTDRSEFDIDSDYINTYVVPKAIVEWDSKTLEERRKNVLEKLPPMAHRVIWHATGADQESFDYFINWLAYIVQTRKKSTIAMILHGTYGTGKGVLYNFIIKPLIGSKYTPRVDMDNMVSDLFNSHLEEGILACIDEADLDSMWKHSKRRSNKLLKEVIAEPYLSIRRMHAGSMVRPSFINLIIFANEKHSAHIPRGDRRYSVCQRQEDPLPLKEEHIQQLKDELPQIAQFFMCYDYDEQRARTPLENSAREFIQRLSMDSNEEVFDAIRSGNFNFLMDSWPELEMSEAQAASHAERDILTYRQAMIEIYKHRDKGFISRNAIESIVWHLTGTIQPTAHKANKWITHQNIDLKPMRFDEGIKRGAKIRGGWDMSEEDEMGMLEKLTKEERLAATKAKQDDARKH